LTIFLLNLSDEERFCPLMGTIVDIAPRLILAKKMRGALKDIQYTSLRLARRFVRETEMEIVRQRIILCDRQATSLQVKEASHGLPLLVELLRERRAYLARLEDEFYGGDREI
jgi:hypothetical protein